jgi:hypothetical protein
MSERGVRRRSESLLRFASWWPLLASALVAACIAGVVRDVRAQDFTGLSPADSAALADSLKAAEEQRVADSTFTADSLAAEEEAAAAEGAFGGSSSILDRSGRATSPFDYNTNYNVNRSNRTWSQVMNFHAARGPLEIANLTTTTIGREGRVGRVNRSGQTQTELAYRVSPVLRLGGRFGIQRITDVARSASVVPTDQANDDASAQARFNRRFGLFPVSSIASYGYLKRDQLDQKSRGTNFDFYAGGSGTYRPGSTIKLDFTQRVSNLKSTVLATDYESVDKNNSTTLGLTTSSQINAWTTADASLSVARSTVRRPLVQADPNDDTLFVTVPEVVSTVNDGLNGGVHFTLPYRTRANVSASLSRNHQVYQAQAASTSITDRHEINADLSKFLLGSDWTFRFGQSVQNNDLTRRDPGYVQTDLLRKLEGEGSHRLSRATSSRVSLGVYLNRRDFNDYVSATGLPNAQSAQDNLRVRGQLNINYVPTNKFDTGVTFGLEQNDLVNLRNTASINNARLRTYSVAWNWGVRPGGFWSVNQVNTATAAQQFYTFSPTRDLVSYVYTLTTNIQTTISPKVRFDLNHLIRLQSRGSYRADQGIRRFGKSSEFNTLDLVLREQYTPNPLLTFEISQRLSVNPQYEFTGLEGSKTSENRRNELTFLSRFNYPLGNKASLNADLRRILATDRNRTFGTIPTDRSVNGDYWLVSAAFRMEFL